MTSIHLGGRRPCDTGLLAGGIARGCRPRRAIVVALALSLGVTVSAWTTVAQGTTHGVAFEMMPDDALSPADERALAQLREALETLTLEAGRRTGRRAIESMARRH